MLLWIGLRSRLSLRGDNLLDGAALPGVDANDQFNDFAFAFPATPVYLLTQNAAG